MSLLTFHDLRPGQYIKVSGKFRGPAGFLAVEISPEMPGEEAEMTGVLQNVNGRSVRVFDCDFTVPGELEIKDLDGKTLSPADLPVGGMLKLKGKYEPGRGFEPKKLKLRETREFNIDEMQGVIAKIDPQKRTLEVNGITIWTNEKTVIDLDDK